MSSSSSEIKRVSVDSGSCGEWGPCALSVDHCDVKTDWLSSRRAVSSHSAGCTSSKKTQQSKIGTCSDDGPCASVKELCDVPSLFQPKHKNCEVMENELTVTQMAYGSCISSAFGNDKACFWSNEYCDDKESFDFDGACTCDKVRVGACRWNNSPDVFHCAVSEAACDTDETFLSVMDLKTIADCYLCREPPATPTTTTVAPLPPPPSSSPVGNPPTSSSSSSSDSSSSSSSSDDTGETMTNTAGSLATFNNNNAGNTFTPLSNKNAADAVNNKSLGGIIVGSIGGVFVAVLLLIFVARKVRQSSRRTGRQEVTSDGDII